MYHKYSARNLISPLIFQIGHFSIFAELHRVNIPYFRNYQRQNCTLKKCSKKRDCLYFGHCRYLIGICTLCFFHIMKTASHHQNYVNSRHISFRDRYVTISMSVTQFLYVKYKQTILQEKKQDTENLIFFKVM